MSSFHTYVAYTVGNINSFLPSFWRSGLLECPSYPNKFEHIAMSVEQKVVVVGGGPVGALAALYAAQRGYEVELYDLRDGISFENAFFWSFI